MTSAIGKWSCLAALLWSVQALAAAPDNFPGVYRSDEFGQIEFTVRDGRVFGRHYGGGKCNFEGRRVIEGTFEGSVLVGRVLLCQTGIECQDDFFDFLAFYNPVDRTLVADIRPTAGGCSAPSLSISRWLKLKAEDRRLPKIGKDVTKKNEALGVDALRQAYQLTTMNKFSEARRQWLVGLTVFDNWAGYVGLGVSEIRLNRVYAGLQALEQAKTIAEKGAPDPNHAQIYFNMACAHAILGDKARAFEYLRKTYEVGAIPKDDLESQRDLVVLHEDRKQWDEIVRLASAKDTTAKNDNR